MITGERGRLNPLAVKLTNDDDLGSNSRRNYPSPLSATMLQSATGSRGKS
jgi:hypothetical protein